MDIYAMYISIMWVRGIIYFGEEEDGDQKREQKVIGGWSKLGSREKKVVRWRQTIGRQINCALNPSAGPRGKESSSFQLQKPPLA
jgi:hypothetical protein